MPRLTVESAARHISVACFQPSPREQVGVEVELLAVGPDGRRAPHDVVAGALGDLAPLASGTPITFEPGGQVELSPLPADSIDGACETLARDLFTVGRALAPLDVTLVGVGLDPFSARGRVLHSPRYDAMAEFFDARCPSGLTMMCRSAGLQVNLDWGPNPGAATQRWDLAHLLGPALAASFANSPLADGGPTGWKSSRLANWWRVDPSRTAPVGGLEPVPAAWVDYALAAQVLLVRTSEERFQAVLEPLSYAQWIRRGHGVGFPTAGDLDYHLGTLFPPVRPRAWMELRIADSLPDPWWRVPVAVHAALVLDEGAAERAGWFARHTGGLWEQASRAGLSDPRLAGAARGCFRAALDALPRMGVGPATVDVVGEYAERYVNRGRCPADDVLDTWATTGAALVPSSLVATPAAPAPAAISSGGARW